MSNVRLTPRAMHVATVGLVVGCSGSTASGESGATAGAEDGGGTDSSSSSADSGAATSTPQGDAARPRDDAAGAPETGSGTDATTTDVSYTLGFVTGASYNLYVSVGGGTPHRVQLDTGSNGFYVPKSALGASAVVSTDACSITYVSSGNTLSGHKATAPIALLGSTSAGDVAPPPTTVAMSLCAVDDPTWRGGMMGVGFGRGAAADPAENALLQVAEVRAGTMRPGYVLSTHPSPNVQIGITAAREVAFQTTELTPTSNGNGDWVATSLKGCVSLPKVPAFQQQCGGLLVDTGVPETILWGPADPTLGGVVTSGQTTVPAGTALRITTQAGAMLDYSFVLGAGADSPSAVNIRTSSAFSINTGRALLIDYDYLYDARVGLVGFRRM